MNKMGFIFACAVAAAVIVGSDQPGSAAAGVNAACQELFPAQADPHLRQAVELVAQRLELAEDVSAAKYFDGTPVDNPEQEEKVYKRVREVAAAHGMAPGAAQDAFVPVVESMKDLEYFYLGVWADQPELAPSQPPAGLEEVRGRLASLSDGIVAQLAAFHSRGDAVSCRAEVRFATEEVIAQRGLDPSVGGALRVAVGNFCAGGDALA